MTLRYFRALWGEQENVDDLEKEVASRQGFLSRQEFKEHMLDKDPNFKEFAKKEFQRVCKVGLKTVGYNAPCFNSIRAR